MSIQAEIVVTLAEVDVADDYRIELRQREPNVTYTWTEAEQLANELIEAVAKAREMLAADFPNREPGEWEHLAHAFDVAPTCRDCTEGKHGACNGEAVVEAGRDVEVRDCGCSRADHLVTGGAA